MHLGGPVDHGRIHFVHTVPGRIRGGSELRPGLWIGGELDDLAAVLAERAESKAPVDDVRIFLGYAGWGESQLDAELAANSWLPVSGRDDWIWCPPGQAPWRAVLKSASEGEAPPEPHEAN
ncbi:MAG: YqgE/AlgH family protein [Planctomycetota bacterium]